MEKRGKKQIKYRELMKCETLNNLQYRYSPPIGRMKIPKRIRASLRDFSKKNNPIKRAGETIVRGA
jgi:hypothetical protein